MRIIRLLLKRVLLLWSTSEQKLKQKASEHIISTNRVREISPVPELPTSYEIRLE